MDKKKLFINKQLTNNISFEIVSIIFLTILIISLKPIIFEVLSESGSSDFHLYPARCLFDGINHYESYINRDGKCSFFMTQYGEYAQGFYVLLFPFTFLEWKLAKIIWFILNICMLILITYFLCKKYQISKIYTSFIIFLILSSIITKATLSMGQQAIFILFFMSLPFIFNSKLSSILSGFSYFKYSIGYGLFIFFLFSKNYKKLIYSLIPCFIGWIIYSLVTTTNPIENLFQPIELTLINSSTIDQYFLFSFMKFFFNDDSSLKYIFLLIPSLILNIFIINKIAKLNNGLQKLSCLSVLILISIPHYPHDYILIVPLVIYSIYCFPINKLLFRINFFGAVYFLNFYRATEIYLNKILIFLNFEKNSLEIINIVFPYMNILLLFLILIVNLKNQDQFQQT